MTERDEYGPKSAHAHADTKRWYFEPSRAEVLRPIRERIVEQSRVESEWRAPPDIRLNFDVERDGSSVCVGC